MAHDPASWCLLGPVSYLAFPLANLPDLVGCAPCNIVSPTASASGEVSCLLSPALFQARVIPALLQLFQVHEEHVRLVLLAHLEAYVGLFSPEQLRSVILPQVNAVPR